MHLYRETRTMAFHWSDAAFKQWSFISHLLLAIVVVSGINLVFMLAAKTAKPRSFRRAGVCVLVLSSLWFALSRFLENALSFAGWAANVYAGTLAVALTLYGFLIVRPFFSTPRASCHRPGIPASDRQVRSSRGSCWQRQPR
jgi:glucose uptake protein GlcU